MRKTPDDDLWPPLMCTHMFTYKQVRVCIHEKRRKDIILDGCGEAGES